MEKDRNNNVTGAIQVTDMVATPHAAVTDMAATAEEAALSL